MIYVLMVKLHDFDNGQRLNKYFIYDMYSLKNEAGCCFVV